MSATGRTRRTVEPWLETWNADVTADETRRDESATSPEMVPAGPAASGVEDPARRRLRIPRPSFSPAPGVRSAATSARSAFLRGAALVIGGVLVGYAMSAFAAGVIGGGSLTGRPAEPVETRAYLDALVDRDVTRLAQLQPPADLGTQAGQLQQADGASPWRTKALTYLGGATLGPVGVYLYVLDVMSPDGTSEQTVPFTFTVVEKKIVRVQ
ncbi:MAG TPA: hypothetical protein VGK63_07465 [Candidatus Limnocylindrales bacterium]